MGPLTKPSHIPGIVPNDPDLVCLWHFNEGSGVPRSVGTEATWDTAPTWGTGLEGGYAELVSAFRTLTNNPAIKIGFPFTFAHCTNLLSTTGNYRLLSGGGSNFNGINPTYISGKPDITIGNNVGTGTNARKTYLSNITCTVGVWHRIVMVMRSVSDATIYVDGIDGGTTNSGTAATLVWDSSAPEWGSIINITQSNQQTAIAMLYSRAWSKQEAIDFSVDPFFLLRDDDEPHLFPPSAAAVDVGAAPQLALMGVGR